MTSHKNWIRTLAVLLVVLVAAVPALAQDTFGLGEEDFALWTAANANSAMMTDALGYDFTFAFVGSDGMTEPVAVDVYGDGVIGADGVVMNMEANLMGDIFPLTIVAMGDFVYVDLTAAGMGWVSVGPDDLTTLGEMGGEALPIDPQALLADPTAALPEEASNDLFAGLMTFDPSTFISIERSDYEGLAMFTVNFDLVALAESDVFKSAFASALVSSDPTLTYEDAKTQAEGMMLMAAPVFDNSVLTYSQYIDEASQQVMRGELVFDVNAADMGLVLATELEVDLTYSADTSVIVAPEGATSLADLLAGLMGSM